MEHLVLSIMKEIKNTEHPVAIFGAGGLAVMIADFIATRGGVINAYVVDQEYVPAGRQKYINGIPVMALETFVNNNENPDIIIGFEGDYTNSISEKMMQKIHKVYAGDFLGYLALGGDNYISDKFYMENEEWFNEFRDVLADDKSKCAITDFINQKRSGIYSKNFDYTRQYFDRDIIDTHFSKHACFIDCGAFRGETTREFVDFLKEEGAKEIPKIYCFEPDHVNVLETRRRLSDLKNVEVVEAGVYDKTGKILFDTNQGSSSKITDSEGTEINTFSLDDFLADKEAPAFIKMDIEGSELAALRGTEKLIKEYKPQLAICIYHRKEDLIDIPQYLLSMDLGYRFYIRNYSRCGVETVLYAV